MEIWRCVSIYWTIMKQQENFLLPHVHFEQSSNPILLDNRVDV